ncbi:MAG TPA: hypothetical protein HA254_06800 [Candidatus Diapherotrites archaeon]|uniref:Uncharacterized protein n=1 Tax=Candidatus Iainarchaeum sp. TaxID=3101447 RepID=A0A7J4IXR7_9ARCH|nr:hypothetical protein [Candidatus Diapherotrites archaeon]
MSEAAALEQLTAELKAIRHDVEYIKEHMVDVDMILTKGEEKRLEESLSEYRQGKAVRLEDFEKEMGR